MEHKKDLRFEKTDACLTYGSRLVCNWSIAEGSLQISYPVQWIALWLPMRLILKLWWLQVNACRGSLVATPLLLVVSWTLITTDSFCKTLSQRIVVRRNIRRSLQLRKQRETTEDSQTNGFYSCSQVKSPHSISATHPSLQMNLPNGTLQTTEFFTTNLPLEIPTTRISAMKINLYATEFRQKRLQKR